MMSMSLSTHLLVAALAGALLLGLYQGIRDGFIRSAFKLLGLVAGLLLARPLAVALLPRLPAGLMFPGSAVVLVLLCFAAITLLFAFVGWLLSQSLRWTPLVWVDRLGGAVLGLLIGLVIAALLLALLDGLGVAAPLMAAADGWEAHFLRLLVAVTPDLFGTLERLGGPSLIPPGAV
jgi:uncharacterized membrane protein required for colicin V production